MKQKELMEYFKASIELQAHYANLLNMWDGGERMIFKTPEEFIKRIKEMRDLTKKKPK